MDQQTGGGGGYGDKNMRARWCALGDGAVVFKLAPSNVALLGVGSGESGMKRLRGHY